MNINGKATVLVGGQWGSEGKGAAAAWLSDRLARGGHGFDIVTTNAGAQAGHTSVHKGVTRVVFHLPTIPLVERHKTTTVYLNSGSIIDPDGLMRELAEHVYDDMDRPPITFGISPYAAVITAECREAENNPNSAQTRIASTRKGVGQAYARKALREPGAIAAHCPVLRPLTRHMNLNAMMAEGQSVAVEVPQGLSLSVNGGFWPHCTSRDCTVAQGLSDAGIHPSFLGDSILVLRTRPIRVGNIVVDGRKLGDSGGCYPDQEEISWEEVGVKPEITTVTKRVRRVFTFSMMQMRIAMELTRPSIVYLTFCDYVGSTELNHIVDAINDAGRELGLCPRVVMQFGPSTKDVAE